MNVAHVSADNAIYKGIDYPVAFILVNDRKDFATFYDTPQSRYEGFFVSNGDSFIKVLSRIIRNDAQEKLEFYHDEKVAALHYGRSAATYSIAQDEPVLIYESTAREELTVRLDVRDQFSIPQWGRNYTFYEDENAVVLEYSDDYIVEPVFMAVLHDGEFNPLGTWIPVEYERDKQRNSEPATLYEYDLGQFTCTKLTFAYGISRADALERAKRHAGISRIVLLGGKRVKSKRVGKNVDASSKKIARRGAEEALNELFIEDRVLAGMPWFTKAWVRDELISLPALPKRRAHAIVSKYIYADWDGGRFPVIFGGKNYCSDGLGLLAWAILFGRSSLDEEEKQTLSFKLLKAIDALEGMENEQGFVPSGERESWMDSIGRTGYPVETQALYSKIIHLAQLLSDSDYYESKRLALLKNIRNHYFFDGYLHDRLYDETIRPNVFLTAFFAPEILSRAEWELCFDRTLEALWLGWGGLSSIDMQNDNFCYVSTGERNTSYHNGDSWFFINNIAALVLHNMDAMKYARHINAIVDASTSEILWHNYVGRPGEISSARALESWGCGLQGFSAAAYIYLVNHVPIRRRALSDLFSPPTRWQKRKSL